MTEEAKPLTMQQEKSTTDTWHCPACPLVISHRCPPTVSHKTLTSGPFMPFLTASQRQYKAEQ